MSATATARHAPTAPRHPLLRRGHNCWRVERATRLAFLVDGEEYFGAVRAALAHARRSFFILGWDIDSRMCLVPGGAPDGLPAPLGPFLDAIVRSRSRTRGYVLTWDYAMLYALEREWPPIFQHDWKKHRRLAIRADSRHPVGASHHQKVIVVDDEVAFVSGFDLAGSRWDTSDHHCDNPLRTNATGVGYSPFHDVGAMVSGPCAQALGDLCRERWRRATGRKPVVRVARSGADSDPWPRDVAPVLENVDVAIARTEPGDDERAPVTEIRQLHLDAIAASQRTIFAENQYFTSTTIADALASRLAEPQAPEIALVMPQTQSGWLEASTMGVLRARIHRRLRDGDAGDRYRFYCPSHQCAGDKGPCINVHSKVLIVDDDLLTLGSANLANRSMCLDTECNLAIEAGDDPAVSLAIAGLRERLLGEHLGVAPAAVAAAMRAHATLHAAIASLTNDQRRWLAAHEPALDPTLDAITPDHDVLDPECPFDPEVLIADLLPKPATREVVRARIYGIAIVVAVLAALTIAWRVTPLEQYLEVASLAAEAEQLRATAWAPVAVPVAFVVAGFALVPVTLLIAATGAVFGPIGALYSFVGAMASAATSYAIGRVLGRDAVRRFAGRRLNELSWRLGKRGLLAMLLVRLLPVAPYTVVNVVAGASRVGWRDYLLGTGIGLLPGIVLTTAFVDRAIAAIRAPGPVTLTALAAVLAVIAIAGWTIHCRFQGRSAPAASLRDEAQAATG